MIEVIFPLKDETFLLSLNKNGALEAEGSANSQCLNVTPTQIAYKIS